jgi:hypothetical protein
MPEQAREAVLEGVGWVILQSPSDEALRQNLETFFSPFGFRLMMIHQQLTSASPEAYVRLKTGWLHS